MADHDVPSQNPMASLRAFTAPLFRGLTAAIVVFIIYAAFNGGSSSDKTTASTSESPQPGISAGAQVPGTTTQVNVDPSTGALVNPSASPGTIAGTSSEATDGKKPGVGVKVQVLQGASTSKSSFESAVSRLKQLGYTVKTGGKAASDYDTTTVFFVKGKESEADALQAADSRFKDLKPKPESISAKDDVHVVVGSDWKAESGEGSSSKSSEGTGSSSSSSEGTGTGASAKPSAGASASAGTGSTSYDPSTSAALPAGSQGAAASNTVPNFAGAAANTATVNSTGTTGGSAAGTTVVNPAPSASTN